MNGSDRGYDGKPRLDALHVYYFYSFIKNPHTRKYNNNNTQRLLI